MDELLEQIKLLKKQLEELEKMPTSSTFYTDDNSVSILVGHISDAVTELGSAITKIENYKSEMITNKKWSKDESEYEKNKKN